MAPLIYPEPTWSNRFGRVVRTLQVVAVAGAIGAVGGGVAVMALVGGGSSSRPPTALKVSTVDSAANHPGNAAPAAPQPNAAAAAVQIAPAASAAADVGGAQRAPAAAEPSSNAAATEQQPVEQAAAPADSSAGTHVYNRIEPEQNTAPAHAPHAHAKATHRIKNAERGRDRGVPYPDERYGSYSGQHYSYRDYPQPPAPRGYYSGGGGVFYDRGGWGNGGWGNGSWGN